MTTNAARKAVDARKLATEAGGIDIQSKFFRELAARTKDKSKGPIEQFELVIRADWASTGTGYIQPVDNFKVLSSFSYDFQNSSATFVINGQRWTANFASNYRHPGTADNRMAPTLDQIIDVILEPVK